MTDAERIDKLEQLLAGVVNWLDQQGLMGIEATAIVARSQAMLGVRWPLFNIVAAEPEDVFSATRSKLIRWQRAEGDAQEGSVVYNAIVLANGLPVVLRFSCPQTSALRQQVLWAYSPDNQHTSEPDPLLRAAVEHQISERAAWGE